MAPHENPGAYAAIHFHDSDLVDLGWSSTLTYTLPENLPSGVYAARLRCGEQERDIPFFVVPPPGKATEKIAMLMSTHTYRAYANPLTKIPGLGGLYNRHTDGSGVIYSSNRRPLLNIHPKGVHPMGLDLDVLGWLTAEGHSVDILTDEAIHTGGQGLLSSYQVVLPGSHPEYWSGAMLDALQAYLWEGGRLMYLGGNGFYWVTGVAQPNPEIIEVRRWGGTQTWASPPGEWHLSTTGELGGLWRNRGRPPQSLVGVGFTSMQYGNDGLGYQRLEPESEVSQLFFKGLPAGVPIGAPSKEVRKKGAANHEIDRFDPSLGSPAHATVLASAQGFAEDYWHVIEERHTSNDAHLEGLVRADMCYVPYPNGGGVFSVGSMGWPDHLLSGGSDNPVSIVTRNVLEYFLRP
jgi:N,N-dimethylformamidase